ncbi:hypothetical protein E2C01_096368 [Portunus trituberculatus]|uniref:Uncharacterized protein n=1 Tax=Portunus trituberculatus TaxID=210409 RepID=A0A5B7JSF5_PORTR|nr:hypothetical protein [Portunus trituberculatus]
MTRLLIGQGDALWQPMRSGLWRSLHDAPANTSSTFFRNRSGSKREGASLKKLLKGSSIS